MQLAEKPLNPLSFGPEQYPKAYNFQVRVEPTFYLLLTHSTYVFVRKSSSKIVLLWACGSGAADTPPVFRVASDTSHRVRLHYDACLVAA